MNHSDTPPHTIINHVPDDDQLDQMLSRARGVHDGDAPDQQDMLRRVRRDKLGLTGQRGAGRFVARRHLAGAAVLACLAAAVLLALPKDKSATVSPPAVLNREFREGWTLTYDLSETPEVERVGEDLAVALRHAAEQLPAGQELGLKINGWCLDNAAPGKTGTTAAQQQRAAGLVAIGVQGVGSLQVAAQVERTIAAVRGLPKPSTMRAVWFGDYSALTREPVIVMYAKLPDLSHVSFGFPLNTTPAQIEELTGDWLARTYPASDYRVKAVMSDGGSCGIIELYRQPGAPSPGRFSGSPADGSRSFDHRFNGNNGGGSDSADERRESLQRNSLP